ncbi:MAG: hypothetical protein ACHQF3_10525 [Alphaproteobacteria bacterium]
MTALETSRLQVRADAAPWSLLALTVVAALLASPALWNGYPLAYYDSVDYVVMPFTWDMPIYRTAAYGVFAIFGRLAHSLWGIIFVQSLMVAYVLLEACRLFVPLAPRRALVLSATLLALLTGLPWVTSQIIPDAFTGIVVLAALVLAFEDGRLGAVRRWTLMVVLAVGTAVHTSHFAILAGLMLCLVAARFLARRGWPLLGPRLRTIPIAFAMALSIAVGSNWLMTGRPFLAQPSAVLTLGLLVQDGLAKRYLDEVCMKPGLYKPRLCMARNRLPPTANDFLWHDADFWKLGGWTGMRNEADRIVQGCLFNFPLSYAWTSAKLMFQQLAMVGSGDGLTPMSFFIGHAVRSYYPREMPAFSDAEQQAGIDFSLLNDIQVPIQLASFVALFPLLWLAVRRRDRLAATVTGLVLLALLGNAFVCGALSNPNDRYQSRIAWVAVLALAYGGMRLAQPANNGGRGDDSRRHSA